jgi:hypothetical protein
VKVKDYCRGCSILFELHALIERKNVVDGCRGWLGVAQLHLPLMRS